MATALRTLHLREAGPRPVAIGAIVGALLGLGIALFEIVVHGGLRSTVFWMLVGRGWFAGLILAFALSSIVHHRLTVAARVPLPLVIFAWPQAIQVAIFVPAITLLCCLPGSLMSHLAHGSDRHAAELAYNELAVIVLFATIGVMVSGHYLTRGYLRQATTEVVPADGIFPAPLDTQSHRPLDGRAGSPADEAATFGEYARQRGRELTYLASDDPSTSIVRPEHLDAEGKLIVPDLSSQRDLPPIL